MLVAVAVGGALGTVARYELALAGFGLDSLVEIFASVVVVWQLKGIRQNRERIAMKLIGVAFLLLAAYVFGQSMWTLLARARPAPSLSGMLWLAATLTAMLGLAWGKHVTGRQLGNRVLITEARVTLIDAALAAAVLMGIGLNAQMGWWWADPLAGLVIVYYGLVEGRAALTHHAVASAAMTGVNQQTPRR